MFLTRAMTYEDGEQTRTEYVIHLAEDMSTTLCNRYTPAERIEEKSLLYLLGGMSLKAYLREVCYGNIKDPNVCRFCINSYKKRGIFE